jgi:hypothetical protein
VCTFVGLRRGAIAGLGLLGLALGLRGFEGVVHFGGQAEAL